MSEAKGKVKKIRKKAESGSIFSKEHYDLCVSHNIYTGSAVVHKKDPSRGMSKHDINISELRELILSIFLDNIQIPKQFEVRNPQFIRDVVVIHFSSCSNGLTSLGRESTSAAPLCCVRNHKFTSPVKDHAHHLLTVSMLDELDSPHEGEAPSCHSTGAHRTESYVLSDASMRTWGFPVPPRARPIAAGTSPLEKSDSKKRKLSEIESAPFLVKEADGAVHHSISRVEGYWSGVLRLPSLTAARAVLHSVENSHPQSLCAFSPASADSRSETASQQTDKPEPAVFRMTTAAAEYRNLFRRNFDEEFVNSLDMSVVAVDCEMCDTANGPELTRISVVDYNGIVVLDCLVKPYSPVLDYKEGFSGLNAELLDPVSIRIEQVQVALLSIMTPSTVLVGHSLENDLRALRIIHSRCVDTTVLFAHPLGFPHRHKLKYLAKEFLRINIQNSNSTESGLGHSSVEDARVALQLTKLKVENGPMFGVKSAVECPREPLVAKISDNVHSAFFFGSEEIGKSRRGCMGCGVQTACASDDDTAVDNAIEHLQRVSNRKSLTSDRNFTYVEISCDEYQEVTKNSKIVASGEGSSSNENDEAKVRDSHTSFKKYSYVDRIKSTLATHSNRDVMLLVSSQASVQEVLDLQKRKRVCAKAVSLSSWSAELEDTLERRKMATSLSDLELSVVAAVGNDARTEK